ncbi:uncharacterized protein C6C3.02c-like [Juglans regia]|uniref:Uncharacterized protein C6C3.02c-like n=2 Tax=Juglans regia TaxID=51240 RepID=A0A2I4HT28_JUGRE|nr:uncharacterized protein C6C3.02c-like [Juglans regia]
MILLFFTTPTSYSVFSTMPRKSSGGRSAPRPVARVPLRNPPAPASQAPPPMPAQGGNGSLMGGLGATIADGMAWGTGTAIAHRAVDAVMGPRVIQHENIASSAPAATPPPTPPTMNSPGGSDACVGQSKALSDCLANYGSDISKCQFYMDMLQECRRHSATALNA